MNIRVSEDWLDHSGAESIHLADGSGVLVQLGLYHELHCLVRRTCTAVYNSGLTYFTVTQKKLKHWIYRSYYTGNGSTIDQEEEDAHVGKHQSLPESCKLFWQLLK